MQIIYFLIYLFLGIISILCFHIGYFYPIFFSVLIMAFTTVFIFKSFKQNKIKVLIVLIWIVYALPFIHIPPYIWFDFNSDPLFLWGLLANPYMKQENIIKLTAMLGAVGSIGIGMSVALASKKNSEIHKIKYNPKKTLGLPIWILWIIIGLILSWLNAPSETVFTSSYGGSTAPIEGANFASSWMMSYVVLTFAFCDAIFEPNILLKKIKKSISLITLIYIVIFLQFLRGDRESLPWLLGLIILYYYWAVNYTQNPGFIFPWKKFILFILLILLSSIFVAITRSSVAGLNFIELFLLIKEYNETGAFELSNFLNGTWSAVLMTPLSVAGNYINNSLSFKFGSDYFDLLLSLPPGFIADLFGFIRPIDGSKGPAWEMTYGLGGTHAIVLPFMNFRMIGVFLIPSIWTYFLINFENKLSKNTNVVNLTFLVTIIMASPHWLWYGEKAGLNAVILWFLFRFFYRISLSISPSFK